MRGVNSIVQLRDNLDTMSDDQYDNYKEKDEFVTWCNAHGLEVPEDRAEAEVLLDKLNEDQVTELHAIMEQ